ncbi:glycosyltransferase family 4 protein [Salegentibacter sp. F188]|uniref:Glycosyltransferase family 4 protein n=1 Tax=Autumnicola patrickiae TaxID=3075591 RepID=A0ABU3E1M1_9FLAO|nr:glycosyltransferase family 4 protein [Salegentibacter sp. F188]MDT0689837.1 glycosyltransferase family 4 protein [Salegentibacter sp. F188]
MKKLVRITTVPLSLEKLLEGQLTFMSQYYEVTAISAEKDRLRKYGENNNVQTFWLEMTRAITPIKDIGAVLKLYRFFKREKPLIVHTHTPKAGIVGMMAAKLANVPIRLHTVAGLPLLETTGNKRKILERVEKLTYSLATKVYPNSKGLQKIILQENFAPSSKLKVLGKGSSNGIDTKYFNPDLYSDTHKIKLRNDLGIPASDIVFIFVGRLVSEKGINELVAAFNHLYRAQTNISLLLVGDYEEDLDPLEKRTVRIIEEHSKIFTTGYQEDVRPYFAISNVLAFPSYREGFPNVVMQAGAMELPAIVTDINGCNEIVQNGENGLIIPLKNEEDLLNAMLKFSKDNNLVKRTKNSAREKIKKDFEREEFWSVMLREYKNQEENLQVDNKK